MAMKRSSSAVFVVLVLVVAMAVTSPLAEAQIPGVPGGLIPGLPGGLIPGLPLIVNVITGNVTCSVNFTTPAPPFSGATVQLRCNGITVASTITNSAGGFTIAVGNLPNINLPNCTVVVITPLVNCNATLPPTGTLVSPLVLTGSINLIGLIINFFTAIGFVLRP